MIDVREATLDEVLEVEAQIDEFDGKYDPRRYAKQLDGREHLCLVATIDGKLVGYKVGYATSTEEFRSWFGGVIPSARRQGVATALREAQEQWVAAHGYKRIRCGSKNDFPEMLRLLIGAGYEIVAVEDAATGRRIIFEAELSTIDELDPTIDPRGAMQRALRRSAEKLSQAGIEASFDGDVSVSVSESFDRVVQGVLQVEQVGWVEVTVDLSEPIHAKKVRRRAVEAVTALYSAHIVGDRRVLIGDGGRGTWVAR